MKINLPTVCLVLAIPMATALAGDLNPPAGAPTSTFKTLHEVEPRIPISQADVPFTLINDGSYYLTQDLHTTGVIPAVIEIIAERCTLDLNGFTIDAGNEVGFASHAILVSAGEDHTIRNGRIIDAGSHGLNALGIDGMRIENLVVTACFGAGMRMGNEAIVSGCTASANGLGGVWSGIDAGDHCIVQGCIANDNPSRGITLEDGCLVFGCIADNNGNLGIEFGGSCLIENCTATNNPTGIFGSSSGNTIANCNATGNGSTGISVFQSLVNGCTAVSNPMNNIVNAGGSTVSSFAP